MRKETLYKILKDMHVIRSGKPNFVILNRYNFCRASAVNLDKKDFVKTSIEI